MSQSPSPPTSSSSTDETQMGFVETRAYQRFPTRNGAGNPLPIEWERHRHPNNDIYYYNRRLRLITPEDIRDPQMLAFILDARDDHLRQLRTFNATATPLPNDLEFVVSDATEDAAVINMYSRQLNIAYDSNYIEEKGLQIKTPEHFWSHVAEYPSHHPELPPHTEAKFIRALESAKAAIPQGATFPFSEAQIDWVKAKYDRLKARQMEGRPRVDILGWLIGIVMPLDAISHGPIARRFSDEDLHGLMTRMEV
ncbi:hypothetical protein H0H93_012584 [Arthromyces matolae]|nr:hypothetical protein H0H93_012584 [Arthromyces matolae]